MAHIVLLGDSIFDNALYVPGHPAVIDQLRTHLPNNWKSTLLAVDGHVTRDVPLQLRALPSDATDLFFSCGGNDALTYWPMLSEPAKSYSEVLEEFARIREAFSINYRDMLKQALRTGCTVTVCTVYDNVPLLNPAEKAALAMFNEIILREAVAARVQVMDLRLVCSDASDYK